VLSSGGESGNDGIHAAHTRGTGNGPFYDGLFEHAGGNGLVLAEGGVGGRRLFECGRGGGSIPNVWHRRRRGLWLRFRCAHWFRDENGHGLRCRSRNRSGCLPRAPRVKQGGVRGVLECGGGRGGREGKGGEEGFGGCKGGRAGGREVKGRESGKGWIGRVDDGGEGGREGGERRGVGGTTAAFPILLFAEVADVDFNDEHLANHVMYSNPTDHTMMNAPCA